MHANRHRRIPTLVRRNGGSLLFLYTFEGLCFLDSKLSEPSDPGVNDRIVLFHYMVGLYLSYLAGYSLPIKNLYR